MGVMGGKRVAEFEVFWGNMEGVTAGGAKLRAGHARPTGWWKGERV